MAEELSGVTIVIFIAAGVLTILLLFIFAKRQIMRFALRSRRGPHIPIGHDTKKVRSLTVNFEVKSTYSIFNHHCEPFHGAVLKEGNRKEDRSDT